MDVNDNFRGWDDDLIAGTVHPIELFEFFHVLRKNNWEGVWQLDQFPFREDSVARWRRRDRLPKGDRAGAGRTRHGGPGRGAGEPRRHEGALKSRSASPLLRRLSGIPTPPRAATRVDNFPMVQLLTGRAGCCRGCGWWG